MTANKADMIVTELKNNFMPSVDALLPNAAIDR
jgi:hypothetical protein